MEALSGAAIFWLIGQGLIIGMIFGTVIKREGVSLSANVIWGAIGSVITGVVAIFLELGDGLLYAFMGTLAVLFLVNVFHQHHEEDVTGHVDKDIRLKNSIRKI